MLKEVIRKHPFALVLMAALAVRLMAALFSPGFIQSDDYYDTVEVSYDWLRHGLWDESGYLHWKGQPASDIARFPLYTLFLYGIMKLHRLAGVTTLDQIMYGIRIIHALLSLLPVAMIFKLTHRITGRDDWAIGAGLAVALHFALPFLGVRNLIEMVAGDIWIVALYCLYLFLDERRVKWLYLAGILSGLVWMVRFQLAFAILPIPLVLWYERKSIRPALHYSLAVGVMLFAAALADKLLLGQWASSTIRLGLNTGLETMYRTIPLMYPVVILAFLIPPFSLLVLALCFRRSFWKEQRLLLASTLSFILFHMAHPNQQERFMIPIIPCLLFLAVMVLWYRFRERGHILKNRLLLMAFVLPTLVINLALLVPFTFAYGHKGLIEPLIWIERMETPPRVMFVQPGMHRWIPEEYAGFEPLSHAYIREWSDLDLFSPKAEPYSVIDYFVFYPPKDDQLQPYLDSVSARFGLLEPVRVFEPSLYDLTMHRLNPGHYPTYKAWVYKPRFEAD